MINPELMELLVCPENHARLALAEPTLLDRLNQAIAQGRVVNRGGQPVVDPLLDGLVRDGGDLLYPIVDGIPVMLIDEAIALDSLQNG